MILVAPEMLQSCSRTVKLIEYFSSQIAPVPTSQEFLDVVLSRTQRQLPTQIRAGFKISRIRGI